MEDIEFSVQISDRDWDCFFAECEECNLLPPSLAGVDDSGMSDIDDTGSILTKRVQKVNLTAGFTEADRPIDGPPDCEGSPVENYLSKHAVGGIESVLSGSEEDLHLQSVNIFFEGLKNLTEAERLIEPSQMTDGKKTGNSRQQAIQEEERCSDGQQASSSYLPKNIPKLNSLPASGETAVGKETMEPVDTISNINTMKKDLTVSNILFPTEPAVCNKVLKTNKSPYTETRLFIAEEACTETRVKEATRLNQSHDSPEEVVRAETTPHTDKVKKVDMCTPLDDVKQEDFLTSQLTLSEMGSADSLSNLKMVADVNPDVLQSDTTGTNKTASQESSPSASTKRKRRKKRRLSVGPAESVRGYERQVLVKQRDSEEEQYAWRGGPGLCLSEDIHLSEDINLSCLNEPQKNVMSSLTSYLATSHLPVKISAKDMNYLSHYSPPCDSQWQYLPESIVREGRCKATGSAENNATNNRSVTSLSQTDDSVMSAPNNNGNVAINLQPTCSKLHVEESTGLPVSFTDRVTGKYNLATETCGRKDTHAWSLQQSAKMNHSIICFENEQNPELCTAEVKSISILPSAESNDPAVEVSQYDKLSAAKSVLAVDAGNSGRHNHTLCQKEAEPQQQLEVNCQDTNQYRPTPENTHFPLSASSYDIHNTKPKQFKTKACPFLEVISSQVGCAESQFDTSDAKIPSNSDIDITAEQTEHPMVRHTLSKFDGLSEKNTTDERAELAASQVMAFQSGNPFISGEINQTGKSPKRETKSTMSEDKLPTSPSDITPVSSCCTLNTESIMSRSNENITDLSESSPVSVNQIYSGDQREKTSLVLAKHEEREDTSEPKSLSIINDTTDSKCYSVVKAEDAITTSKAECEPEEAPDSKHSVFAISSFWSEMEKLTINDILGLRMMGKAPPPSLLPSLQESEETDMFAMLDSGGFTQLDESKPEQTDDDTFNDPNSVESSTGSVVAVDSYSSRGLTWESIGTDIYSRNMMLTSVGDISQPVLPGGAQTGLRKISKNVSVHNLHALASESIRRTRKGQTLQPLDEEGQTVKNLDEEHQHLQNLDKGELQNAEYFTDGHMPKEDKDGDTFSTLSTDGYRISLKNIFQYLFSGKQSIPSQSATDDINTWDITGNSVPETYDYFFSEFDTESFFCPLITAEDQTKDTLVPIFSYSRSANRNLQFPEAYDHFFASSSSDDSSVESDEEESCGPVRVVTRSSHTLRTSQSSTDIYENFFTDSDLRQNFFWKTTLSFRNIRLIGSTVQEQTLSKPLSRIPVRQSGRPLGRTVHPTNALGNQDVMFPDPLLYHLEDRIYTQLAQQSFRYEDLQTAVSNPRLDTSFLPLRQSDMCLVCIAFASWVLKTANPQVGDTWKAVLLANVSALSAIRYLRKYVKLEAAASEEKLNYTTPSDS